jgi:hypothetical protein
MIHLLAGLPAMSHLLAGLPAVFVAVWRAVPLSRRDGSRHRHDQRHCPEGTPSGNDNNSAEGGPARLRSGLMRLPEGVPSDWRKSFSDVGAPVFCLLCEVATRILDN